MRPGLFTAILVKYLPTFEVNFMLKLFSFPLILKSSINIFLSIRTKPASLYKEYFRFSNQDLDITDLRQNRVIINHHMSKDFLGQHTSTFWFFFARR